MSPRLLSPEAEQDLDEINTYLNHVPPAPAQRVLDSIEETIGSILSHPYLGAAHSELTRLLGEQVRSRLVAPYRIYYRIARSGPEIISILHGSRDLRSILGSRFSQ
ncbi:MAG TPA: type II toxin-antitoxin system RelE/ParE family toxin [Acidobacteriaceae bacterium]|nr:type II toxin-antitoxin system RelE/ParE family toxin [Acidobacteriaceae bacterium]